MLPGYVWVEWEHVFVYRPFDLTDYEAVKRLAKSGQSDYAIASTLGIPRSTVQHWRHLAEPPFHDLRRSHPPVQWRPTDGQLYSYLLGAYLGDGHMCRSSRYSWRLGITLDLGYPAIIEEVAAAMEAVATPPAVCRNDRPGAVVLLASSTLWPVAFPQHGAGKKHQRRIELLDWQRAITHQYPEALLRGLIHSDGCRSINRFRTTLPSGRVAEYAYPRYFFSNLSADIRSIFCEHCDLLGIRWTRSNARNISVAHRGSVARMDAFIGPKA